MDENQRSNQGRAVTQRSGGFFQDLTDRFRLISRLMVDSRVNIFLKILPVGTLVYALWPMDVPGPIDDVFVIWLGTTLFVQLCPPDVVEEHLRSLSGRKTGASSVGWKDFQSPHQQENIIDGEYYEADPGSTNRNSSR